jgi:hypothetical protein
LGVKELGCKRRCDRRILKWSASSPPVLLIGQIIVPQ